MESKYIYIDLGEENTASMLKRNIIARLSGYTYIILG